MKNYSTTKERQHLTSVWRIDVCSSSYASFVLGSSAVLRLKFCANKSPLRQASEPYQQVGIT